MINAGNVIPKAGDREKVSVVSTYSMKASNKSPNLHSYRLCCEVSVTALPTEPRSHTHPEYPSLLYLASLNCLASSQADLFFVLSRLEFVRWRWLQYRAWYVPSRSTSWSVLRVTHPMSELSVLPRCLVLVTPSALVTESSALAIESTV